MNILDNNLNEKIELNENKIFKFEYENQKIDNNINYLKWKDSIIKKYDNDVKIFKCKQCKILFYSKNEDMIKNPYYSMPCPICKKYICYFCSCSYIYSKYSLLYCCRRRILNICFFISAPSYSKDENLFNLEIFMFLIPIINILGLFRRIETILFFSLPQEISKNEGKFKYYENSKFYEIMVFIIPIVLGIPFFFIDIYHIIFLFLISIPFKLYPFKYYLGVIDIKGKYFI